MGDESQYLQEWGDYHDGGVRDDIFKGVRGNIYKNDVPSINEIRATYNTAYKVAKIAPVGSIVICICGKKFTKRSYQQAFCCNKGKGNCKDRYHNITNDERLSRARSRGL